MGDLPIGPASGKWTVGESTRAMKFTFTDAWWRISLHGSTIQNVKYGLIRTSTGPGAGKLVVSQPCSRVRSLPTKESSLASRQEESSRFKLGLMSTRCNNGFQKCHSRRAIWVKFQGDKYFVVSTSAERALLRPTGDGQIGEYVLLEIEVPLRLIEVIGQ